MFTQSCFIRKNTPELRKKLEELGYNRYPLWMADWSDDDPRYKYLVTDVLYYTYPQEPTKPKNGKYINCGTNEELFLALVALRDDNDYMQWFTDGEKWFQNQQNDIEVIRYGAGNLINFHKAAVEEIIKHFKDKYFMTKNYINIAEILKDCPKGTKLYSPLCGECYFDSLNMGTIICKKQNTQEITFTSGGYYMLPVFDDCECQLFPSKDQRDWSKFEVTKPKFDITTLKPFKSEVLVRNFDSNYWKPAIFGFTVKDKNAPFFVEGGNKYNMCIPYEGNEHLLGTTNDCIEYYKTWE